jgi:hypothetical protein
MLQGETTELSKFGVQFRLADNDPTVVNPAE